MDETPVKSPPPVSWSKLALIPVLGGVLWYVLSTPSEEVAVPTLVVTPQVASAPAVSAPQATTSNAALPMNLPLEKEVSQTHNVTWPSTPLAEVMAINPFQLPPGLLPLVTPPVTNPATDSESLQSAETAALATAEREQTLAMQAALKQHRLTALVHTSKGVGAIVGDTVVAVGDTLGERFRITEIRPDGLVLKWIAEPPETALKD